MCKKKEKEWEGELFEAHQKFRKLMEEGKGLGYEFDLIYYSTYYRPNKRLVDGLLGEIEHFYQKSKPTQKEKRLAGYKLEELALTVFHGLNGWFSIKSYQSATAQYDLLMSGEGIEWQTTLELLPLKSPTCSSTIVVEAKATRARVSDAQFSRLCSLMQNDLNDFSVLGVFFTFNGASGFPKRGSKPVKNVGQSRLRQLLFYVETRKPIVVFDITDIRKLSENGSLLRIISRKIREIEEQTGLPVSCDEFGEIVLPENLRKIHENLTVSK